MKKLFIGLSILTAALFPWLAQAYVVVNKTSPSYTYTSTTSPLNITLAPGASSANISTKPTGSGVYGSIKGYYNSVCRFDAGSNANWTNTVVPVVMTNLNMGQNTRCGVVDPTICCSIMVKSSGF